MVRTWKSWMTGIGRAALTAPAAATQASGVTPPVDCRATPARRQSRWRPSTPHYQGVEAISRNPSLRLRRASSPSDIVADALQPPQTGAPTAQPARARALPSTRPGPSYHALGQDKRDKLRLIMVVTHDKTSFGWLRRPRWMGIGQPIPIRARGQPGNSARTPSSRTGRPSVNWARAARAASSMSAGSEAGAASWCPCVRVVNGA